MRKSPSMQYHVQVKAENENQATATAREHSLTLNIKKGSGSAGFNAAETVMAALGTCILTNIQSIAEKKRMHIRDTKIEIQAERIDNPPGIEWIRFNLLFDSDESPEKLEELFQLSLKWGTVTNTLMNGVQIEGDWVLNSSKEGK